MMYEIAQNKTDERNTEIICQKRNNHYLKYLEGSSGAEEVYIIVDESH